MEGESGGAAGGPSAGEECEEREGCAGLWELPVERSERRPECSRCSSNHNEEPLCNKEPGYPDGQQLDWEPAVFQQGCRHELHDEINSQIVPVSVSVSRPQKVCLCPFLPIHPLKISTCLYIIQHPAEESRVLRTVPLLAACLPSDKCKILVGRRFSEDRKLLVEFTEQKHQKVIQNAAPCLCAARIMSKPDVGGTAVEVEPSHQYSVAFCCCVTDGSRYPELAAVCRDPSTLILYPGAEATNLEEVSVMSSSPPVMIIIDGTWSQAKDIFYKNSLFRFPRQVQLKTNISSQYVIRTQPTNNCLSTLECAAVALTIMEKNKNIQETILRPLQALCSFQLQHGAQIHHSKEHLLKNGLYDKPMPKNKRKLRRMELLLNNVKI